MSVLAEVEGPDVLTDVLSSLRLRGRLFCRSELSAPWSLALEPGDFAHFHVVERGGCWIHLTGDDRPRPLASGDLVVLPHGQGHTLSDRPDRPPVPISKLLEGAKNQDGRALIQHGGGGAETALVCGSFRFEGSAGHPLLSLLPPLI
ncbi:MAG TPA: cupin domain-containing protein, partial [Thermoanaerobaculia bacterium]|nr:cupin domain-containing protein [Thermoanaerobaculia bacterium]